LSPAVASDRKRSALSAKCREGAACDTPRSRASALRLRLSKLVSGILRHFPDQYGGRLDEHGWASVDELVAALRRLPGYSWLQRWHIEALAALDPKGRFELRQGRIRARYGHSVKVEVEPIPGEPPPRLYHGTTRDRLLSIMVKGLLPMKRLKVHLTTTPQAALEVARRHGPDTVILEVDVDCLKERGLKPQKASETVYVTDRVPPECLKILDREGPPRPGRFPREYPGHKDR